jgi:hypothetical protein
MTAIFNCSSGHCNDGTTGLDQKKMKQPTKYSRQAAIIKTMKHSSIALSLSCLVSAQLQLIGLTLPLPCLAQGQGPEAGDMDKTNANSKSVPKLTSDHDKVSDLTLSDLRDAGLSLNQIRQEAINIFLEVTRKTCHTSTKSELNIPALISEAEAAAMTRDSDYLPPRPQWLVYYVGTIEPIISLFTQDVKDAKAGVAQLMVPADTKDKMLPLWDQWIAGTDGINKELTAINELIDDGKAENVALARHAAAMFKLSESLEGTRQKAFHTIAESEKRNLDSGKINLK